MDFGDSVLSPLFDVIMSALSWSITIYGYSISVGNIIFYCVCLSLLYRLVVFSFGGSVNGD